MSLVSRSNQYYNINMKYLKKFEGFFGGTHLGSDQVNTDSAVVKNVTGKPEEYANEEIPNTLSIWTDKVVNYCNNRGLNPKQLSRSAISNILDRVGGPALKDIVIPKIYQEIKEMK